MERKGFELALSTLILLIIGVLVLIGIAYMLTNGFESFRSGTKPFLDTTQAAAVREACNIACASGDKLSFCCRNFTIGNVAQVVYCNDARLDISCEFGCEAVSCLR